MSNQLIHRRSQLENQRGCRRRPPDGATKPTRRRKKTAQRLEEALGSRSSKHCPADHRNTAQRIVKALGSGLTNRWAASLQGTAQQISIRWRYSPDSVAAQPPGRTQDRAACAEALVVPLPRLRKVGAHGGGHHRQSSRRPGDPASAGLRRTP